MLLAYCYLISLTNDLILARVTATYESVLLDTRVMNNATNRFGLVATFVTRFHAHIL